MKRNFLGKRVWLVGASTGIGAELAKELSRRGARLVLSARSVDKLESLAAEIGKDVHIEPLDVADHSAIESVAAKVGDLDGVVFLAAAYNPEKGRRRIAPDLVNQTVSVNLTGAIHLVQSVRDKLVERDGSFLALYASIAGYRGLPNGQPYSATKAGLINYAESLRTELHGEVDVKVINSGFVDTRITRQNDFSMPMLMEPTEAARRIADGLERRGFEICFPRRFAYIVKALQFMPYCLYFLLARRLR